MAVTRMTLIFLAHLLRRNRSMIMMNIITLNFHAPLLRRNRSMTMMTITGTETTEMIITETATTTTVTTRMIAVPTAVAAATHVQSLLPDKPLNRQRHQRPHLLLTRKRSLVYSPALVSELKMKQLQRSGSFHRQRKDQLLALALGAIGILLQMAITKMVK